MQSLEAMLSLIVLVWCASLLLAPLEGQRTDDSLYRLQLVSDAWRVLYLRGDFQDFGDAKQAQIDGDLETLGYETALCFFLEGTRFTNCRGGGQDQKHEPLVSLHRTVVEDGLPKEVMFSVGK